MRRLLTIAALWAAIVALAASGTTVLGQGPGGAPGVPMPTPGPRDGPSRCMGTPGAPMARMGRSGMPQGSAPTRRNYGGIAGVPGKMSSQQFRSSTYASQARNLNGMGSAAGIVNGATRGAVSVPAGSR